MSNVLISNVIFIFTIILTLFLPGWLFLNFILKTILSKLEIFILSIPISFSIITLFVLVSGKLGMPITKLNILILLGFIIILGIVLSRFKKQKHLVKYHNEDFSKKQLLLLLFSISLMIFIKTAFLVNTIFPTATDLGHHMFWVKKIISSQELVQYNKVKVIPVNETTATNTKNIDGASFSKPQPIADFIIGEHIIFVVISLLTGLTVVSSFPSLILFIINIFTAFVLLILSLRLFHKFPYGKNSALFSFLLIGPLYAISGAQEKFVSGGVIGNIFGNLLILSILFFLYISFTKKSKKSLLVAVLLIFTIIYTHHLSTFILIYTLAGIFVTLLITNWKNISTFLKTWRHLFLSPTLFLFSLLFILFLVFIYTPSYLNNEAISSATGAPTKSTRTGIGITQLKMMVGDARLSISIIGFLIASLLFSKNKYLKTIRLKLKSELYFKLSYEKAIILGWFGIIFLMITYPNYLNVNIISSRIATYIAFPCAIIGGFILGWLFFYISKSLPNKISKIILFTIFLFIFSDGLLDSTNSLKKIPKTQEAVQTFHAAKYLSKNTQKSTWILKDHNFITSDTWIKVFLSDDYSNPLSRSYFKRYETHPNRERCTLEMISNPNSKLSKSCFKSLTIGPIMINTSEDSEKFNKNANFIKVYENNNSSIYWKK